MRLMMVLLLATIAFALAEETMIPTTERNGRKYISAAVLTQKANIAVKTLPGQKQIALCSKDRCAPVQEFLREGNEILVSVEALSQALGARVQFDGQHKSVRLEFSATVEAAATGITRVGQLAPNFGLTRLDGSPVALSDYRGKRVVINSWASW